MNRFVKQDEVILDRKTGLMWPQSASLSEFPMTWNEALLFVRDLNRSGHGGYNDWKLPNRRELFSIMSLDAVNPSLPMGHPFVQVFHGYYWTSTTCARLPDQAWYVHLGGARVFKGMKLNSYMVWPVRVGETLGSPLFQTGQRLCYDQKGNIIDCRQTGQDGDIQAGLHFGNPRFVVQGDVVHDTAMHLTWTQHADIYNKMVSWPLAYDLVDKMNKEKAFGYHDWRVPGILELEGLTDMGRHSPALPTDHPFHNVRDFYWSATTSKYDDSYAWTLYIQDGAVGVGYKILSEFFLWPVRGSNKDLTLGTDTWK